MRGAVCDKAPCFVFEADIPGDNKLAVQDRIGIERSDCGLVLRRILQIETKRTGNDLRIIGGVCTNRAAGTIVGQSPGLIAGCLVYSADRIPRLPLS